MIQYKSPEEGELYKTFWEDKGEEWLPDQMEHEITVPFDLSEPIMEPVTIEPRQTIKDMKESYSLNVVDTTNDHDQEETITIKT